MGYYIDKDKLRDDADIVSFAEYLFGAPYKRTRDYSVWSSPFRATTGDSPSFTVWHTHHAVKYGLAVDFGDGGARYDIYALAEKHLNMPFSEAVRFVHEWYGGHGLYVSQQAKASLPKQPRPKAPPTMDELQSAVQRYGEVRRYIEDVRRVSHNVALSNKFGSVEWSKYIQWQGREYKMPVSRVVIPYLFNDRLHGWVTRRADENIIDWMENNVSGMFEYARFQYALKKGVPVSDVSDGKVLDFIQGDFFSPENHKNPFNDRLAMERYVEKGRRSIFGLQDYASIVDGKIKWNTFYLTFTESELDASALKSVGVNACAFKSGNRLNTPIWRVVKDMPMIFLAVQNDDAARAYMKRLYDELIYVKDNHPSEKPRYVINWLYAPKGVNDFAEAHEKGILNDHISESLGFGY